MDAYAFNVAIASLMKLSNALADAATACGAAAGTAAADAASGEARRAPPAGKGSATAPADPALRGELRAGVAALLKMAAPLMPHVAAELWLVLHAAGDEAASASLFPPRLAAHDVHAQPWPSADPTALVADTVQIVVTINGKRKGALTVPAGDSAVEAAVRSAVLREPELLRALGGALPPKAVFVPGRILNFIVSASA